MALSTESLQAASALPSPEMIGLLTPAAAAALIGSSLPTLARWRRIGTGPKFVKLGRKIFYQRDRLMEWVESNAASTTAELKSKQVGGL